MASAAERMRKWRSNPVNRQKEKDRWRARYYGDPEYRARQQQADRERKRVRRQLPEEQAKNRRWTRAWQRANPGKVNAQVALRTAKKLSATPTWLTEEDLNMISQMYETCPHDHHVDHIIPLQGKTVSGLHVPWNLQHLPAQENLRKHNHV